MTPPRVVVRRGASSEELGCPRGTTTPRHRQWLPWGRGSAPEQAHSQQGITVEPAWGAFARERTRRYEGRTGDALAPGADEGRGRLRKASGSRLQALSRGCPNAATCVGSC